MQLVIYGKSYNLKNNFYTSQTNLSDSLLCSLSASFLASIYGRNIRFSGKHMYSIFPSSFYITNSLTSAKY